MEAERSKALKRHRIIWRIIYLPFLLLCRVLFNYRFTPVEPVEGPYIVVANHSNEWDQFFVALAFGPARHMYFLASDHIFRKPLVASLLRWLVGPIARTKGGSDASAVRAMLRWLKDGVSICLFPEGENCFNGRTGPMHPATAKLLKISGASVVSFRITGGHLSLPRWAHSRRRGRIEGSVVGVYSPAQLRSMSTDEINALLERDLRVDAFGQQEDKPVAYKGRRLAVGLEQLLYLCPVCGKTDSFTSRGSLFSCSGCGLTVRYGKYGFFNDEAPFRSAAEWDDWQEERLKELCSSEGVIFSDSGAELRHLDDDHNSETVCSGSVSLDRHALHVADRDFPLAAMADPSMCNLGSSEFLLFSPDGHERYELHLGGKSSLRKYYRALELLLGGAEK